MLLFLPIIVFPYAMLSSHGYYAFEVNLFFSNYAEKIFVHRQNISFSIVLPPIHHWMHHKTSGPMRAHALNGGQHIIITFSRGEGFGSSLLFSLV